MLGAWGNGKPPLRDARAREPLPPPTPGTDTLEQAHVSRCARAPQDARDALLGKLFGLGALVRAGLVHDAADASLVVTELLALGNKKVGRHSV